MTVSKRQRVNTDVLIIGGGTAGCYAALTIRKHSDAKIVIAEKAHIKRSGCLAAGVNAINCYILPNRTVQDYVDYATNDAEGIVRDDLLRTMCERVNGTTHELERLGLVILKDEQGQYVARGNRNIKINGENIKPILADAVQQLENCTIINQLVITDYLVHEGKILGAVGFHKVTGDMYEILADYVLCATGGASGVYRPNNPGFSRHKMWYSPFNTGAGYAMGIREGAEMTTFEMRFIALRCKDTIAPTGTIAQGVGAKQINRYGDNYEGIYGITTSQRVYGTVQETVEGRGPCYLGTQGINDQQNEELLKAYLNMAPSQTLRWVESGKGPQDANVEIEGTEPYIVGGHTASGYWVNTHRETTIRGLFAAGDVAGGCPQKYVTGALAEGEIVGEEIARRYQERIETEEEIHEESWIRKKTDLIWKEYQHHRQESSENTLEEITEVERTLQDIMDRYAGGISQHYNYTAESLKVARDALHTLQNRIEALQASDAYELSFIYEVKERWWVAMALIHHLEARKETRWHSFGEHGDFPDASDAGLHYVNSVYREGHFHIIERPLVEKGRDYEHSHI